MCVRASQLRALERKEEGAAGGEERASLRDRQKGVNGVSSRREKNKKRRQQTNYLKRDAAKACLALIVPSSCCRLTAVWQERLRRTHGWGCLCLSLAAVPCAAISYSSTLAGGRFSRCWHLATCVFDCTSPK